VYPTLFTDDGITYLAGSQCYIDYAYRQYKLVWKEDANATDTMNQSETVTEPKPDSTPTPAIAPPSEKTGTVYEADMNSADGWTLKNKVPAGVKGSLTCEDGMYILVEDEISRTLEIDLTKNPVFSVTVEEFTEPRLFVRLQIPGLSGQPGYDIGYIGFEALGHEGVSTFDINEELEWLGYFDGHDKGIVKCTLNLWAHLSTVVISDVRIEYFG